MAERTCPYQKKCGGCAYIGQPYEETLKRKEKEVRRLLKPYGALEGIVGMDDPYHYRNKIHRACSYVKVGRKEYHISGIYREGTHKIVQVRNCLIENETADKIIEDILELAKSFKIQNYNEDTGLGLLRHILIRTAHATGQVMVVLVLSRREFPGKNHFIKALLKLHPEIRTVVFNINNKRTSMILGETESTAFGPGYIEDILCGDRFRISPKSFYQVNSAQTEKLYEQAVEYAGLTGRETVLDAYCGIGTIGMTAAARAKQVIGVELNHAAVRDARENAKRNGVKNIRFVCADAGEYLMKLAETGRGMMPVSAGRKDQKPSRENDRNPGAAEHPDVIFMDPPRAGSTEEFLAAAAAISPKKIVYISCNPITLASDLDILLKKGYRMERAKAFDMFPFTQHVETVVLLGKRKPDSYVKLSLDMEDYYRIKDGKKPVH